MGTVSFPLLVQEPKVIIMKLSLGFTPTIQGWIFATEGGYVDHPKDPGGATNMGITFKVLKAWYGRAITKADVKNMPKAVAVAIYEKNYWNAVRGNSLPLGLDYAMMDYAVNSGVSRAIKDLQRCLGAYYTGTIDGVAGAVTLTAVKSFVEAEGVVALIYALCERRFNFVKGLSTFATFGKGWTKRIWGNSLGVQTSDIGVADRATMLSGQSSVPIPAPTEAIPGQASPEAPSITDAIKDPGIISAVAGAAVSIFGAVADQPVLQIAIIAGIAFLVYRFVIVKQKVDPA